MTNNKIYSQQSNPNSYQNSYRNSPQKQEKKKVITLDIGVLKDKIDGTRLNGNKKYYMGLDGNEKGCLSSSKIKGWLKQNQRNRSSKNLVVGELNNSVQR